MSHDAQHFSSTFAANAGNDIPKPREEVDPNTLSAVNFGYENFADLGLEFETQAFSRMIQKL
ncbi:MAG: hypothetical protein KDD62_14180, partial [Bdellovibrionales bacterium]|nr:hypothetical protein [Bdellovibrionales bacterium]